MRAVAFTAKPSNDFCYMQANHQIIPVFSAIDAHPRVIWERGGYYSEQ
jgi:hypothetical protein